MSHLLVTDMKEELETLSDLTQQLGNVVCEDCLQKQGQIQSLEARIQKLERENAKLITGMFETKSELRTALQTTELNMCQVKIHCDEIYTTMNNKLQTLASCVGMLAKDRKQSGKTFNYEIEEVLMKPNARLYPRTSQDINDNHQVAEFFIGITKEEYTKLRSVMIDVSAKLQLLLEKHRYLLKLRDINYVDCKQQNTLIKYGGRCVEELMITLGRLNAGQKEWGPGYPVSQLGRAQSGDTLQSKSSVIQSERNYIQ